MSLKKIGGLVTEFSMVLLVRENKRKPKDPGLGNLLKKFASNFDESGADLLQSKPPEARGGSLWLGSSYFFDRKT